MHPWLRRFLQGFSFQINYQTLLYIAVCFVALAGALIGSLASGGDLTWIILSGAGFYIAGRLFMWVKFRV